MTDKLKELEQQIAELNKQRQELLDAAKDADLKTVMELIAKHSFSAKDLGLGGPERSTVRVATEKKPAKYQNPKNPDQKWAGGKGAVPKWVKVHTDAGGKLEDLLINKI